MTALTTGPAAQHAIPSEPEWQAGSQVDGAALRAGVGAFPTGVTVVTARCGEHLVGMTVSSFTSVSLEPPLVLLCISRRAGSLPALRIGSALAINVLAAGQGELARRFAAPHEDRFAGIAHTADAHGSPLLDGTAAAISGHVERIYDAGDHLILITRVEHVTRSSLAPLLYHAGTLHTWLDNSPEGPQ